MEDLASQELDREGGGIAMYNVYRMEQGQPDTLIGVAETPGEAAETIENDKMWLGREADYRWQYEEKNQEDE